MSKTLLIDGSGILVANYYGTLPSELKYFNAKSEEEQNEICSKIHKNKKEYCKAIYPTIRQIFDLIVRTNCEHIVVAFDRSRNTTFRKEYYKDYKGQRDVTPTPLKIQFDLCEKILKDFNIATFAHEKFEADDIIGSLSEQLNTNFNKIIIYTKDKDYLQLANKNVTIWMNTTKEEKASNFKLKYNINDPEIPEKVIPYTPELIKKEKGIDAPNFCDVLSLMGDTADNIPGVKGISERLALLLIQEYKNKDNLYDELKNKPINEIKEKWKNLNIKPLNPQSVLEQEDKVKLSYFLAKIKLDINLNIFNNNFSLDNIKIPNIVTEFKKVYQIEDDYLFKKLVRKKLYTIMDKY